jgi:small subunit ribosomal protein S13
MRISGVELRKTKRVVISLCDIFGIGLTRSKIICEKANIDLKTRVSSLSNEDGMKIQSIINDENWVIEGELKRKISDNMRKKIGLKTHEGRRLIKGLPLRQKTKRNAKTSRRMAGTLKVSQKSALIKKKGGNK